jgi:tripartite ATP-independent transporter DctM subunit
VITLLLVSFLILLFLGMPVAFAMAISGVLALLALGDVSLLLVPQRMYLSLNSFPLLAVPFFILAGEIMNAGGLTKRIVAFANALVGHFRGGLGHVNVVANMIMAGVSGSASADAVAIGSVMIPAMVQAGYPAAFAAGLTASAATIGPIIPPSIVMVIYGSMTGVSIGAMFLGGVIPGVLIGLGLMAIVWWYARQNGWERGARAPARAVLRSFLDAFWAILAPIIIVGGILSGIFTPTEAGVIACLYSLFVGFVVNRELTWRKLWDILLNAAVTTSVPLIILSGASIFGWILARQRFATYMVGFITDITASPLVAYLIIVAILLFIGLFIEALAAILIFVPVLLPIGQHYGFDPVHFALVIIIAMLIGTVTPPVGIQLYIASAISRVPVPRVVVWPFVSAMTAVLIAIVLFPATVVWIPSFFFK